MRRTFPRTPSSPQASVTVETPAHYAPTLLLQIGSLSEVVIGSVEPIISFVPKNRGKGTKKIRTTYHLHRKVSLYCTFEAFCADLGITIAIT